MINLLDSLNNRWFWFRNSEIRLWLVWAASMYLALHLFDRLSLLTMLT